MSNEALQIVMQSHLLPQISATIEAILKDERDRRERFYQDTPENQKAEFIDGKVVIQTEFRDCHLAAAGNLLALLHPQALRLGGKLRGGLALCMFPRNDYQPDLAYFGPDKSKLINGGTVKYPIPDFVVEILADSTEAIDRGVKFIDYEHYGVHEYWIVDPRERMLEQYLLNQFGQYELATKSHCGEVAAPSLQGYLINVEAIFGDSN